MRPNANRICIIGPSTKFLSGISYYTMRLANAFADKYSVSVILLRNLVPKILFPGSRRVGSLLTNLNFKRNIQLFDGIDWYWFPKILTVPFFLKKHKSDTIIFQWWTSAVAHSYFALLVYIKLFRRNSKLILVFHETQDPLESSFFILRFYARIMGKLISPYFDAFCVHSNSELELVHENYKLPKEKICLIPMGSFDNYRKTKSGGDGDSEICSLLFFGLIRPYKGVEYLIDAFSLISKDIIHRFELIIAGEPWDYDIPEKKIAISPYKNRIRYIGRYISDDEVDELFSHADVAIFPYTRASQSGAAHVAISYGIPIIVSRVGGLRESMESYQGTIFVEPHSSDELVKAILECCKLRGRKFANPHQWENTVASFEKIFQ